ncbi:hydroxymethylbilane synthase [soil metagenome]
MARIVLGGRGSAVAVAQTRTVLADLMAEWPDVQFTQRTFPTDADLLSAVTRGQFGVALFDLATLPPSLPEGVALAAVTKRLEPRTALVTKNRSTLAELPPNAAVGVQGARDEAFVCAARADLQPKTLTGNLDAQLAELAAERVHALLVPCAHLSELGRRSQTDTLLEPDLFPPAPGQGSTGLVVQQDDDMAYELAYSLQHRPSFDRMTAERAFAAVFETHDRYKVGALATVTSDGELTLFGAGTDRENALSVQAEVVGEAAEAAALGRELGMDVLEQLG